MTTCIIQIDEPAHTARGIQTALHELWHLCRKDQNAEWADSVEQAMLALLPLTETDPPHWLTVYAPDCALIVDDSLAREG